MTSASHIISVTRLCVPIMVCVLMMLCVAVIPRSMRCMRMHAHASHASHASHRHTRMRMHQMACHQHHLSMHHRPSFDASPSIFRCITVYAHTSGAQIRLFLYKHPSLLTNAPNCRAKRWIWHSFTSLSRNFCSFSTSLQARRPPSPPLLLTTLPPPQPLVL